MHVVVCYDVTENRRRNRLLKFLKGYIRHVQKSVFEGEIDEKKYEPMRAGIASIVDRSIDTVRIYQLCGRCIPAMDIVGTGVVIEDDEDENIIF